MQRSGFWLPLALAGLAFYDLRIDIRLLIDHFTWTSLFSAITAHPLAVAVLVVTPALIRRS
ncbi:MAG: hypothetical protein VKK94_01865 [Cyanobacteriota bacterium]|jgi:hypothetical protein|nr:hypothetical protein [Cyanobacteriota bacterium]